MRVRKRKDGYAGEVIEERSRISKINKRRAKDMERNVANLLEGHRVPMSGASYLKGDALFYSKFGLVIVECKLSSLVKFYRPKQVYCPNFNLRTQFLEKLQQDVKSMKAIFGVLVFKYWNTRGNYVIVKKSDYDNYIIPYTKVDPPIVKWYSTSTISMYKITVDLHIENNGGMYGIRLIKMDDTFVVMSIDTFIEAIGVHDVESTGI